MQRNYLKFNAYTLSLLQGSFKGVIMYPSEKNVYLKYKKGSRSIWEKKVPEKSKPETFLTQFVKSFGTGFNLLVFFKKGISLLSAMSLSKIHTFQIKNKMLYHFLDCMSIAYTAYAFPVEYSVISP